ncbi:MAG: hypothetical protein HN368_20770, partial [Spirochaetales bacterium]|nr:hypothetical protein [Spirochaetales bacterium]
MRKSGTRFFAVVIMLIVTGTLPVFSQTFGSGLFWESPSSLVESPARFSKTESSGGRVVVAWQESMQSGDSAGDVYLSVKTSIDGANWNEYIRYAGPYRYVGKEVGIVSLTVDDAGVVYIVVTAEERKLEVFRLRPDDPTVELISVLPMKSATIAPRISMRSDGGLLLFASREPVAALEDDQPETTTIVYFRSDDGETWSSEEELIEDEAVRITLHFLQKHAAFDGKEYAIFQAFVRDPDLQQYSNQLFVKISEDQGRTWSPSVQLSNFSEFSGDENLSAGSFDNQAVFLYPVEDRIIISWERRRSGTTRPQVYYGEIGADGAFIGIPEQVSRSTGSRSARAPKAFVYDDRIFLIWFDNRAGSDHVILAAKTGTIWNEYDLSEEVPGISRFGSQFILQDRLHFVWENRRDDTASLVLLAPDRTVDAPVLSATDFASGERHRQSSYSVSWNLPVDSSRIEGFSILWDREPDSVPAPEVSMGINERKGSVTLEEDGVWFVHVAAKDRAGNWSDPSTLSFFRDTTPPGKVAFTEPEYDDAGFITSNTQFFTWSDPSDSDIAGYSYRLQLLYTFAQIASYTPVALKDPAIGINLLQPGVGINNADNGLWALSVSAIDNVGNVGEPETL